ncbi:helix-turn-helix DNA binding domain protein [Arthrobacter phage Timinator]|uniref:Helix-turn-helix DNA binding domain protein n=2 Tax=Marthavirus barretlemon TaxID=2560300 RepID=A0A386KML8_9CAUD|nr:helix-turn-helix DNA binding domain protein [Arthrobacter phage Timinator]AYD86510.1 helix-turn-helix DNA binding domain protein [Arthrobacter phage LeeroyJ]
MRRYAKLQMTIWADEDWRNVSHTAQWLYTALISQQGLSACGVRDWKPKLFAALSPTMNRDGVESALEELIAKKYVVLDDETDELLIRSFVRNDEVHTNRNMMISAVKAQRCIVSLRLAAIVVHEMKRLRDEHPDFNCWEHPEIMKTLASKAINVFDEDVPEDADDRFPVAAGGWGNTENPY